MNGFDWSELVDSLIEALEEIPGTEQVQAFLADPDLMTKIGQVLKVVGLFFLGFAVAAGVFALIVYILRSISLFTIGRRRGCKLNGFAWIPGLWVWTLGSIADAQEKTYSKDRKWRHVLLWLSVLCLLLGGLSGGKYVTKIITLASAEVAGPEIFVPVLAATTTAAVLARLLGRLKRVLVYICYAKLFENCSRHPVLLTVLSIVCPVILPFVLMAVRRKDGLTAKEA